MNKPKPLAGGSKPLGGPKSLGSAKALGGPARIGALVSQLLSRRGYAQVLAADALQAILEAEVGTQLASSVRVGNVKRGSLHIYLADSVTHQELTFRKRAILGRMQAALPESGIREIRFHVSAAAQSGPSPSR